ncbi:MAG: hypothetical protein U0169_06660 [Polyangiaceae bacterium]
MSIAALTGIVATVLVFVAATFPVVHVVRTKKRAAPGSGSNRFHVVAGSTAALVAFGHVVSSLGSLGSPEAVGAGSLGLAVGALAFFVLVAHASVGLELRKPKIKDRPKKRRIHVATALTIVATIAAHVVFLLRS